MFLLQQATELGSLIHVVLVSESRQKKGVMESPSTIKEICEFRYMSGVSMNRDLERPLCEVAKVKPGMPRRLKILEMPESWDT